MKNNYIALRNKFNSICDELDKLDDAYDRGEEGCFSREFAARHAAVKAAAFMARDEMQAARV